MLPNPFLPLENSEPQFFKNVWVLKYPFVCWLRLNSVRKENKNTPLIWRGYIDPPIPPWPYTPSIIIIPPNVISARACTKQNSPCSSSKCDFSPVVSSSSLATQPYKTDWSYNQILVLTWISVFGFNQLLAWFPFDLKCNNFITEYFKKVFWCHRLI